MAATRCESLRASQPPERCGPVPQPAEEDLPERGRGYRTPWPCCSIPCACPSRTALVTARLAPTLPCRCWSACPRSCVRFCRAGDRTFSSNSSSSRSSAQGPAQDRGSRPLASIRRGRKARTSVVCACRYRAACTHDRDRSLPLLTCSDQPCLRRPHHSRLLRCLCASLGCCALSDRRSLRRWQASARLAIADQAWWHVAMRQQTGGEWVAGRERGWPRWCGYEQLHVRAFLLFAREVDVVQGCWHVPMSSLEP